MIFWFFSHTEVSVGCHLILHLQSGDAVLQSHLLNPTEVVLLVWGEGGTHGIYTNNHNLLIDNTSVLSLFTDTVGFESHNRHEK